MLLEKACVFAQRNIHVQRNKHVYVHAKRPLQRFATVKHLRGFLFFEQKVSYRIKVQEARSRIPTDVTVRGARTRLSHYHEEMWLKVSNLKIRAADQRGRGLFF